MKKTCLYIILFLSICTKSFASHIIGGEIEVTWISGNKFQLNVTVYRDCNGATSPFDNSIDIGIFERYTNAYLGSENINGYVVSSVSLASQGCSPPSGVCIQKAVYSKQINLADNPNGYYLSWQSCCRNNGIDNIRGSGTEGIVFYTEVADPSLHNSNPIFQIVPVAYMCVNEPFTFPLSGFDADGDSLVYRLVTPFGGSIFDPTSKPAPYDNIKWKSGFSLGNVTGSSDPFMVEYNTGFLKGTSNNQGIYVMAVVIEEYRNGIYLGLTRREMQFNVFICNINYAPEFPTALLTANAVSIGSGVNEYEFKVNATDTLCFDYAIKDSNPGDSIYLTYSSNIFSGGSVSPPYAVALNESALDSIKSNFCWATSCSHISSSPYYVYVNAKDNGCPFHKSKQIQLKIYVNPPPLITSPNMLCIRSVNTNALEFTWADTTNRRYFNSYVIYRGIDSTGFLPIDTIFQRDVNSYLDNNLILNSTTNYSYYIQTINSCGLGGAIADTIYKAEENAPLPNYLKSVSVIANNQIQVSWEPVDDPYFSTFSFYRKENNASATFNLYYKAQGLNANDWTDLNVDTQNKSYCYQLIIKDSCGRITSMSNMGCSILLQGKSSQVEFHNDLNWSEYKDWTFGVEKYNVLRRVEGESSFINIGTTISELQYVDYNLPSDGGKYYYIIEAIEDSGSASRSLSNQIELVQLPHLFVPNAFTPNNDGINDSWGPPNSYIKEFNMKIFNRWGELIFETSNPAEKWNGANAPMGVYVYLITYSGYDSDKVYKLKGSVSLIR